MSEHVMDNPGADRVKKTAALSTRAGRRKQGRFLAEGPQPVREALALWLRRWEQVSPMGTQPDTVQTAGSNPEYLPDLDALYFAPDALQRHPDVAALLHRVRTVLFDPQRDLPRRARLILREATPEVLAAMGQTETTQGLVAVCRIPDTEFAGLDSLLVGMTEQSVYVDDDGGRTRGASTGYGPARLVAGLLRIQDPGNVGTIIRTADAAGADAVVASEATTDPWSPKVVRSAAGSHFHLPVVAGIDMAHLSGFLQANGATVLAASGTAAHALDRLDPAVLQNPSLWLFGNEAHGLSDDELALADHPVAVPLFGQAESLNVSVAAGICLYASAMAQSGSLR